MPMFDDAQFKRQWLTRYMGGFDTLELVFVIVPPVLAIFVFGPWNIVPVIVLGLSIYGARWSRKIQTDGSTLQHWLVDSAKFHFRRHPFRAKRTVGGKPYDLRRPHKVTGIIMVPRRNPPANPSRRAGRRKLHGTQGSPAIGGTPASPRRRIPRRQR